MRRLSEFDMFRSCNPARYSKPSSNTRITHTPLSPRFRSLKVTSNASLDSQLFQPSSTMAENPALAIVPTSDSKGQTNIPYSNDPVEESKANLDAFRLISEVPSRFPEPPN
ncbi:hypothetical protein NPIL_554511 [Nephila pilipes]|uniref:Uncharacterized protein n=1 Tax=Nephila pilipes TaxID=299642 RepID=A0A8X6P7S9_NEPPI|nr:hypothetical protein NPIL_554511 [Nephila pilipes]